MKVRTKTNRLSLKLILEGLISELIAHGDRQDPHYIILYKQDLWMSSEQTFSDELFEDMQRKIPEFENMYPDFYDLAEITEERDDVLFGEINVHKHLYIITRGVIFRDPKSSLMIKKVVDFLNLKSVSYSSGIDHDTQNDFTKQELTAKIPNIGYHGTSGKYLSKILKLGLKFEESPSNYSRIGTPSDAIFFSSRFDEAEHHAIHTSELTKSDPVVISFKIPDKNKLVVDFDVKNMTKFDKPFSATKETGIYGYKGRIPSSFFEDIFIVPNVEENFTGADLIKQSDFIKVSKEEAETYIETKDEFGYGTFEYPEFDEDEDESSGY